MRRWRPHWASGCRWSISAQRLLEFVDAELIDALQYHLRGLGVSLRLARTVAAVTGARMAA